jgi:FKBP-type peptidyl-prolyl cis-trans isomerase FkpA
MKRKHRMNALVLLAALVACGDGGSPTEPDAVTFAPSLGIDLTQMTKLPSGVYIQTVTPGTGDRTLTINDNWTIEYQFWLTDGTLVDNGPLRSETDCAQGCIEGFELGILGQKVGEVRKIVIPSRLGYGENPPGGASKHGVHVPKHAVLVYETRVVGIR